MTAQDQQSHAELSDFEAWYAKQCMRSDDAKQGLIRAWAHLAWKAARALPSGMEPVARIRYERNTPGRENEMPRVMSCNRMADGVYEVFTAAQVQTMGRVPPGWQAVPVEPTGDMLAAIMSPGEADVLRETPERHQVLLIDRAGVPDRYTALLAAAPRPPAAQERAA